jgi:hypothetical protein
MTLKWACGFPAGPSYILKSINSRKITCDYYIDDKAVLPAMLNA